MKKILLSALLGVFITSGAMADPSKIWVEFYPAGSALTSVTIGNDAKYLGAVRDTEFCGKRNRYVGNTKKDCKRRIEILTDISVKDNFLKESCGEYDLFNLGEVESCFEEINGNIYSDVLEERASALNEENYKKEMAKKKVEEECGEGKGVRKCEKSATIAKKIKKDYSKVLELALVKEECTGPLIGMIKIAEITGKASEFGAYSPKDLRKCRRVARKMSRMKKKIDNLKDAKAEACLDLTDFKAIRKCIKKGKIAKQINEKWKDALGYEATKKECGELVKSEAITADIYDETYLVRDMRRCKRMARKMTRLAKKLENFIKNSAKFINGDKKFDTKCLEKKNHKLVKSCMKKLKKAVKVKKKKLKKDKKDKDKLGKEERKKRLENLNKKHKAEIEALE